MRVPVVYIVYLSTPHPYSGRLMFSGDESIRFKSTSPPKDVAGKIESALNVLGSATVDRHGEISIRPRQSLVNFLTETRLKGDVHERDGEYAVTIEYDCTLSTWGWALLIFFIFAWLLGLLVLLGPGLKKNDVAQAVRRAIRGIPDDGGQLFDDRWE